MIWSPDTCFCEYEVKVELVGNVEKLVLVSVKHLCSIHDHMGDQGAFSSALNRNNVANSQNESAQQKLTDKETTRN